MDTKVNRNIIDKFYSYHKDQIQNFGTYLIKSIFYLRCYFGDPIFFDYNVFSSIFDDFTNGKYVNYSYDEYIKILFERNVIQHIANGNKISLEQSNKLANTLVDEYNLNFPSKETSHMLMQSILFAFILAFNSEDRNKIIDKWNDNYNEILLDIEINWSRYSINYYAKSGSHFCSFIMGKTLCNESILFSVNDNLKGLFFSLANDCAFPPAIFCMGCICEFGSITGGEVFPELSKKYYKIAGEKKFIMNCKRHELLNSFIKN